MQDGITDPEVLLRKAQKGLYELKSANMMMKPQLAERLIQDVLDAVQLIAADVRIIRDGR